MAARARRRGRPAGPGRCPGRGRERRRRPRRRPGARRTVMSAGSPPTAGPFAQLDGDIVRVERLLRRSVTVSPAIPPPTTTTATRHVDPAAATMRRARAVITLRSSLTTDMRRTSPRAPARRRFDVDVVEHLEVIGDEAARTDQNAVDVAESGQLVDHAEQVRLEPWFRRPSGRLPGDRQRSVGPAVGGERGGTGDLER